MMNIPSIRDRRRLVEMLTASQTDIAKPTMSKTQNRIDINGKYPSWNAVKRIIIMSKAISKKFRSLTLFVSFVMVYLLQQFGTAYVDTLITWSFFHSRIYQALYNKNV